MSTTIQVPASAITRSLYKCLGQAQEEKEIADREYEDMELKVAIGEVSKGGFVHTGALDRKSDADARVRDLSLLWHAVNNNWPINIGSENFYLLEVK